MEFHLPFFALRKMPLNLDRRIFRNKPLREVRPMFTSLRDERKDAIVCEGQLSFLVVGVDEWFLTVYCFADTFLASEMTAKWYVDQEKDGPSAWTMPDLPCWNPREYFLFVLSRRLEQITREWRNLIQLLERRLEEDVRIVPLGSSRSKNQCF